MTIASSKEKYMTTAKIHKGPCNVKLPNGSMAQFFKSYPGILLKNLNSSDDVAKFFSDSDIIHTGKYEKYEHGKYEIIIIKAGTKVDINVMPNNSILVLAPNSRTGITTGSQLGIDFDFDANAFTVNTNNAVSNQSPTTPPKVETKYKL